MTAYFSGRGDLGVGTGRPLRIRVTDAAEVLGVARILPKVLEHRHARTPDPTVMGASAKLEQFKRAVHFAECRMDDGEMEVLHVLGFCTSFQFREPGPGFLDASRAGQRPGIVTKVERSPAR